MLEQKLTKITRQARAAAEPKAAKKAVAKPSKPTKPAPEKTKELPATPKPSGRQPAFADTAAISLSKEFDAANYRGSRGERAKLLKDGMTVGDWNEVSVKKVGKPIKNWLHALVESKALTVK